ncbi:MAG: sigma-70 family RNA polymerase sigma factor [bacterium]
MALDEGELLRRLRRGDSQAFAQLVGYYKDMVTTMIARMRGSQADVEDLAQEVFLRVWKGLPGFRGEAKLSTWIYRIAINLCIAEGKTARARAQFLPAEDPAMGVHPNLRNESNNPYAEEAVLKDRLARLLPQMPEKYRIAITLFYLKNLSYFEIGEIMDIPMGTVKSYLFRGKAWLREKLLSGETTETET